jgi:phospholipase D1/2
MEIAEHSITILGWDIRSDLLLEPDASTETLAERFVRLLDGKPGRRIRILIWDWLIAYSLDREILPQWRMAPLHDRLEFVLDDNVPVGGAANEKVVVIDGKLAFVGGIDLTAGRWDTTDHDTKEPRRCPPDSGEMPPPFHDVTIAISGPAAASVGELAARRWQRATDQTPGIAPTGAEDLWPETLAADLQQVTVAISRTRPAYGGDAAVQEIRSL